MRYQLQTLAIIMQMKSAHCYTFVRAARLGDPDRVERQRRSLRSLALNHSFAGYRMRGRESEDHYRRRMRAEYGTIGDAIRVEERVGRNKRPYTAYSGVIFKIAVGDAALHTAYLSLVYLMLAPEDVNSGSAPFLAAPQRRNAVFRLLRDHCKQIGAPDPCCKQDWFARIPHGAFAVALDWVIGRRPYLPGAAPDATIRAAFIARVMRPERLRLAVQRAAWLSRRALMVRPLSAQAPTVLVPAPKAVVPTTGFKPVPFRPFEEISSETREGSWSAWWLLAAVALLLLLIPMRTVEQENEVISAPDEQALRIMPLYTRLNIEGEAPRKTSGIEQEKIPDIASPDQLERYFIPEP